MHSSAGRIATFVTVAALLAPAAAAAQSVAYVRYPELAPGIRVRIEAPSVVAGRYEGTVISRAAEAITLAAPNAAQVSVPFASLSRIEISRGKSRLAGMRRGALWGLGVGAGLAAVVLTSDCTDTTGNCESSERAFAANMLLGGAVWGAGIGAAIGRERWVTYAPDARVSIAPDVRARGFAISATAF